MITSRDPHDVLQEAIIETNNITDYLSALPLELILKIATFLPSLKDISHFAYTSDKILNSMKKFPMDLYSFDGNIQSMMYEDYIKLRSKKYLLEKNIKQVASNSFYSLWFADKNFINTKKIESNSNSGSDMEEPEDGIGPDPRAGTYTIISSLVALSLTLGLSIPGLLSPGASFGVGCGAGFVTTCGLLVTHNFFQKKIIKDTDKMINLQAELSQLPSPG